ncbi:PREDICTED: uncharacterized protein LOC104732659 [Camelina sativa]|uniref:Uncharacterized protein LOC104732659 n=1 Tax=Camelina sativa TaxID=90675 RepID=A0ABM1QRK9_CAMSA|nr:PREDICTED: uncharacterized protein LOC104732659 [Camelina sativa]
MASAGEFCEGDIDGKMFFLYNFLSQTESSTSSSSPSSGESAINLGAIDLPSQPLFLCPSLRFKVEELKREDKFSKSFIPFTTSPHFPSPRRTNQQVKYLLGSHSPDDDNCKLPVVPLFWCNNKESDYNQFSCGACQSSNLGTNYYFCVTCHRMFHKECVESPLEINHPSYPFRPLQLVSPPYISIVDIVACRTCNLLYNLSYDSPTYKLTLDPVCAMKSITFVIDHPKQHLHPLTFFPKQAFLPCNVCGLIKEYIPTYACLRCVFVVHQDCIYFPHVIKISRHHHRISFISSLPYGKWFCGVCRREVDKNYGAFTCNKCSDYFVHTRCALRRDLWDGEDLDGVPEEDEIIVEPFETIADGRIIHFSHSHYLKISEVYEEDKCCQACVLPIYEGNYYSCIDQCEFFLHETCANSPRKIHHPLHPRPLTLKVVANENYEGYGPFRCDLCGRESCGFVYESLVAVGEWSYKLDLRCASVSEPFEYQGHDHPLFLALSREEELSTMCQVCQEVTFERKENRKLNCIECDYIICFRCATLPFKARYKHDKHFLTFWKVKEASDHSGWCEVCERKIVYSRKGGFYACDDCCTTIHVDCLLGEDMYMKHGESIKISGKQFQILRNSMTRPFCHERYGEEHRCPQKVVFKLENKTFCSLRCS